MTERIVGIFEFTNTTELQDVEILMSMFQQRWNLRAELNLGEGYIRLWKNPEGYHDE